MAKGRVFVFPQANGKVACHKVLLAAANPVFKHMFYGPLKKTGDVVAIKVKYDLRILQQHVSLNFIAK